MDGKWARAGDGSMCAGHGGGQAKGCTEPVPRLSGSGTGNVEMGRAGLNGGQGMKA